MTTTGSGPDIDRGHLVDRIADLLEATAGDLPAAPSARLRRIR